MAAHTESSILIHKIISKEYDSLLTLDTRTLPNSWRNYLRSWEGGGQGRQDILKWILTIYHQQYNGDRAYLNEIEN
jgi:hypothetical protein